MATYVMSDIHGHGDLFRKMLEKIGFSEDDKLYIIGDVVDRGPDGIKLLQQILHTPNIVFLLGNHEDLLLRYLYHYGTDLTHNPLGMLGNHPTISGFKDLLDEQKTELVQALMNAPIHEIITVNGQHFYLVHAFPANNRDDELWNRPQKNVVNPIPDTQVIIGHTPTIFFERTREEVDQYEEELFQQGRHFEIYHGHGFIGIDCGCGTAERVGALACLRLEDLAEFYVPVQTE